MIYNENPGRLDEGLFIKARKVDKTIIQLVQPAMYIE